MTRPLRPLRVALALHESRQLGSGVAVARLVPHLREFGWSVTAWVPGDGPISDMLRKEGATVVVGPERPFAFSAARLRAGEGRDVGAIRRYAKSFAAFLREVQPHVVHANTLLSIPEAGLARRHCIPVVMHVQEPLDASKKSRAAMRAAASLATAVIVVEGEAAAAFARHTTRVTIHTIINGVAVRPASASRENASGAITVGTVGSASRRKGTDLFVQAAARICARRSDIVFHHIGDWDAERDMTFLSEVGEAAAPLIEAGRLRLYGVVADPADIAQNWTIFVLPSRKDPYPLALLEAMALGLPPVASRVSGIPDIVADGRTGLLTESGSVDSLVRAVLQMADAPDLRRRLGDAARVHVELHNSLSVQAGSVHAVYLSALATAWGPKESMLARTVPQ
jgi:glycosyltransferase involved in cell wall biosynthesis